MISSRRWSFFWAGLFLIGSMVVSACGGGSAEPADEAANNEPKLLEPEPVNVSVIELEPDTLVERTTLAGRLDPWTEVHVASELGGTVQEIGFDKGRWVKQGQMLAKVGTDLLEASLQEVEAELMGAQANFKKMSELFDRQAVPRQDLVAATAQHDMSKARVSQARLRVERSLVRAPASGIAVTREIERGEVLNPGAAITSIHQISRLKATVGIPESDISFFKRGDDATVTVDAYPDEIFKGQIHFISSAATQNNRTFEVEVSLSNEGQKLRPGMIGRVALTKRVFEDAVVVPRDALLERDSGSVGFVLEGERVRQRELSIGPSDGDRLVVLEGLSHGETLVVRGHRGLVDDQKVKVISPAR